MIASSRGEFEIDSEEMDVVVTGNRLLSELFLQDQAQQTADWPCCCGGGGARIKTNPTRGRRVSLC